MTIIRADYIFVMNEDFEIKRDFAVAFDKKIIAINHADLLRDKYPQALFIDAGKNSLLMPGLINPHVHLEFSANKTSLVYGDFIMWLKSVITKREDLLQECQEICIKKAVDGMLQSGTTTIGAVSSFGIDLKPCVYSKMNVVYFNEVLGSNPAMVDALYENFQARLYESISLKREGFIPAISVHSPYSTHPILAKKALNIAKDEDMTVSTHFMESRAEREWIDSGVGDFVTFFQDFAPNSKPVNSAMGYLELFEGIHTLFTHATYSTKEELEKMQDIGYITHCPVSNRLLNNGCLRIEEVDKLTLGTDGLSSNNSLNLWDEMRMALMMHTQHSPHTLAQKLLLAATLHGAKSLSQNSGEIAVGKDADIIITRLPDHVKDDEMLALLTILHVKDIEEVYIAGDSIKI